jgi:hypothetical protein
LWIIRCYMLFCSLLMPLFGKGCAGYEGEISNSQEEVWTELISFFIEFGFETSRSVMSSVKTSMRLGVVWEIAAGRLRSCAPPESQNFFFRGSRSNKELGSVSRPNCQTTWKLRSCPNFRMKTWMLFHVLLLSDCTKTSTCFKCKLPPRRDHENFDKLHGETSSTATWKVNGFKLKPPWREL